jgi:hypothetical protein
MGMDYVGVLVPISRTREEAKEALRKMSDEYMMLALRDTIFDPMYDYKLYTWEDDAASEPNGINRETMLPHLDEIIDIVYDIADGEVRAATWYQIDTVDFVSCGGATWGDAPEFYDELVIASQLGVTYDNNKKLAWV